MRASLVSREVIADSIELAVRGALCDGVVALSGCDKTIPGTMMALARLDVPGLMLYGGSIMPGNFQRQGRDDPGRVRGGRAPAPPAAITESELRALEDVACPGAGACGGQFTANTMSMAGEMLGISPMGAQRHPGRRRAQERGGDARRQDRHALVAEDLRPSKILTRAAFENAITGGRHDGGLDQRRPAPAGASRTRRAWRSRSTTSTPSRRARRRCADLKPGGRFVAADLDRAGGVRLVAQAAARGGAAARTA